jgi:arsenate reductase
MDEPLYNVLSPCTGSSARSSLAESVLNHLGRGEFMASSAGSHLTGVVRPLAVETLTRMKLPLAGLRCKRWDEFAAPGAPPRPRFPA